MKLISILITPLMLAGCSEQDGKIYPVNELVADEALLSRVMTECRNNPGDLRGITNCRSAEATDGKLWLQRMRHVLGG